MIYTDGVHLVTDGELKELHMFALLLGLKPEWFQDKRLPHYDLTSKAMFDKARAGGAQYVTAKYIVEVMTRAER